MSDIKWIKLSVSMFDDEKIRIIESMPESDTIIICWIKLLSLAGKTNANGFIFIAENIPYTDEMLAAVFNRSLNTVRMALDTFRRFGMIDIDENHYISINNWSKHQSVDRLEQIKEQNRLRKQKQRERQRQLSLPSQDCHVTGHEEVTDIEEEKELDKDLEKDIKKKNSPAEIPQDLSLNNSPNTSLSQSEQKHTKNIKIPYEEIVSYLNGRAGTQYRSTSKKTQVLIKARWAEGYRLDDFKQVIDNKTIEWINNPNMIPYLRPETLFGTKFESYLNQRPVPPIPTKGGPNRGSAQSSNEPDFEYIGL